MRLLLKNQLQRSKPICRFPTDFRVSGVPLSPKAEKTVVFRRQTVDARRFCGTLSPLTCNSGKALVSIQFDLARFLLKPIQEHNAQE